MHGKFDTHHMSHAHVQLTPARARGLDREWHNTIIEYWDNNANIQVQNVIVRDWVPSRNIIPFIAGSRLSAMYTSEHKCVHSSYLSLLEDIDDRNKKNSRECSLLVLQLCHAREDNRIKASLALEKWVRNFHDPNRKILIFSKYPVAVPCFLKTKTWYFEAGSDEMRPTTPSVVLPVEILDWQGAVTRQLLDKGNKVLCIYGVCEEIASVHSFMFDIRDKNPEEVVLFNHPSEMDRVLLPKDVNEWRHISTQVKLFCCNFYFCSDTSSEMKRIGLLVRKFNLTMAAHSQLLVVTKKNLFDFPEPSVVWKWGVFFWYGFQQNILVANQYEAGGEEDVIDSDSDSSDASASEYGMDGTAEPLLEDEEDEQDEEAEEQDGMSNASTDLLSDSSDDNFFL